MRYEDDPDYQRWLEQCAKECTCCDRCAAGICGGVLAGGFCDGRCFCPDEYDDEAPRPKGREQMREDDVEAPSQAGWTVELWDAINDYATACGGDPSQHVYGNAPRMAAVAKVHDLIDAREQVRASGMDVFEVATVLAWLREHLAALPTEQETEGPGGAPEQGGDEG